MSHRRLTVLGALLAALMLTGVAPLTTMAADRFGAKLTGEVGPTERQWCRNSNHSTTCTWIAVEAFANGGHEKAPRDGTIRKVRLISCVAGSFRVQVARARPFEGPDGKGKIVRQGPTINYAKDPRSECGGSNNDDYRIQSFSVNFHVNKGDYIAAKGTKIGFYNSSSSGPSMKFRPALPVGGSYEAADDRMGSLLLEFVYGS
jgi:hypothetical protein